MRLVYLLTFAGGAILGIAGTLFLIPSVEPIASTAFAAPSSGDQTDEIKRLRTQLDDKDASLAQASTELINLRKQLVEAQEAEDYAETLREERNPEEVEEQRQKRREEAMQLGIKRFTDRRTDDLVQRFGLTEQQVDDARAYFQSRSEFRIAEMMARRAGEAPPVYEGPSTREALAGILDPGQMAAYDEYNDAVQTSRSDTRATSKMNAIAPDLGLTEAQKDQVYSVYYNDTQIQFDDGANPLSGDQRDVQLDANMQAILSPEQYAQWKQMEEEQNRRRGGGRGRGGF